jgi:hypothetical protein
MFATAKEHKKTIKHFCSKKRPTDARKKYIWFGCKPGRRPARAPIMMPRKEKKSKSSIKIKEKKKQKSLSS